MDALRSHLDRAHEMKRDAWVWGFSEWGKEMLVFVACTAARRALPVLEDYVDPYSESPFHNPSGIGDLLEAAERWLIAEEAEERNQTDNFNVGMTSAVTHLRKLDFFTSEASGSAEASNLRKRALYAANAGMYAGWAFQWQPQDIDEEPWQFNAEAEREARLKAGPALETVTAVSYARYALGLTDVEMKDFLAAEIRNSPFLHPSISGD